MYAAVYVREIDSERERERERERETESVKHCQSLSPGAENRL